MTDTIPTKFNVRWECIASPRTGAGRPSDLGNATNRARYSARTECRRSDRVSRTRRQLLAHHDGPELLHRINFTSAFRATAETPHNGEAAAASMALM
jgi:hypothetical protein